jgi:hypothetical protein
MLPWVLLDTFHMLLRRNSGARTIASCGHYSRVRAVFGRHASVPFVPVLSTQVADLKAYLWAVSVMILKITIALPSGRCRQAGFLLLSIVIKGLLPQEQHSYSSRKL